MKNFSVGRKTEIFPEKTKSSSLLPFGVDMFGKGIYNGA